MRGLVLAACAAAVLAGGCKRRTYDRSTPDAALASFFRALDKGDIPDQLELLVATETERAAWRLRCRTRGCKGGTYKVLERETSDYEATFLVDYEVTGREGERVMRGEASPVLLIRERDGWRITQFGRKVGGAAKAVPPGGEAAVPAGVEDAGAGAVGVSGDAGGAAPGDAGAGPGHGQGHGHGKGQ